MPKIPSYPLATAISNEDLLVMDDVSAQYATKSLEMQLLKGFINTGQATTTYVEDRVVTGASFNTNDGVLTLTRSGGEIPAVTANLDGRYALTSSIPTNNNQLANGAGYTTFDGQYSSLTGAPTLATVATSGSYNDLLDKPTIPAAYTDADVDTHLNKTSETTDGYVLSLSGNDYTWVAQSGGGGGVTSITAGSGISISPSGGTGDVTITNTLAQQSSYTTYSFSAPSGGTSNLASIFNGNASDQKVLVIYPGTDKLWLVLEAVIYLNTDSGTYTSNGDLYIGPDVATPNSSIGVKIPATFLNSTTNKVMAKRCIMDYELAENDIKGTNLVLKAFSSPVGISNTGATLKINYSARLITNLFD